MINIIHWGNINLQTINRSETCVLHSYTTDRNYQILILNKVQGHRVVLGQQTVTCIYAEGEISKLYICVNMMFLV